MLRKIHLHGELGELHGELFELAVDTASEAVRALCMQFPDLEQKIRAGKFHVIRGDADEGMDLDLDECAGLRLGAADLHIVPVIAGSAGSNRKGGILKIVLGIALIGAAFFFSGGAFGAAIGGGGMLGNITYGQLALLGVAMTVAGISTMLTPEEEDEKKDESFLLSGPGNNYEQGAPVPVVYGEIITGSVLISGGIDVEQLEN